MSNGRLDARTLAPLVNFHPVDSHAGGLALPEVAQQWALMAAACLRDTGRRLDASEGYRDYATQVYMKAYWTDLGKPENANAPGYSVHGLAAAVDAGSGAGTKGSVVEVWIAANAHLYGFVRDVSWELWHLHYVGAPLVTPATAIRDAASAASLNHTLGAIMSGNADTYTIYDHPTEPRHFIAGNGKYLAFGSAIAAEAGIDPQHIIDRLVADGVPRKSVPDAPTYDQLNILYAILADTKAA